MIKPGIYKHSKSGKEYRVIDIVKHSETLEDMVLYEPQYHNELFKLAVRPASMWEEEVEIEGQKLPRFQYLREA